MDFVCCLLDGHTSCFLYNFKLKKKTHLPYNTCYRHPPAQIRIPPPPSGRLLQSRFGLLPTSSGRFAVSPLLLSLVVGLQLLPV